MFVVHVCLYLINFTMMEFIKNCGFVVFRECSKLMVGFHKKAGTGKLTGVHRKYCTSKFGYAARSEPAGFLLEERL